MAGERVRERRFARVPLLGPRRAAAGPQRRRGGRLRRGALSPRLRGQRHHRGRRDQRDARPAAPPRRQAPCARRCLPQWHRPRPPLPLPIIQVTNAVPQTKS